VLVNISVDYDDFTGYFILLLPSTGIYDPKLVGSVGMLCVQNHVPLDLDYSGALDSINSLQLDLLEKRGL
jgi:hypothetical protein